MAGIPQITNPVGGGKGYTSGNLPQKGGDGSPFEIIQIEKPISVGQASDKHSGSHAGLMAEQKEFLQMSIKIAKDPTLAVESLKQIINNDLLTVAKINGYTQLHGELNQLMKSLFIPPQNLVSEIMAQERDNTMFSGSGFFNLLREIAVGARNYGGEDLENAIGNMLKAINFMQSRDEILRALSSNLKFLSGYFAPNKGLSEDLFKLAEQWNSPDAEKNFESLKRETLYLLKNVSESLLNNDRTQVLIPLIVHNMSRYNTNQNMLLENFSSLLALIPDQSTKYMLADEFEKLLNFLLPSRKDGEAAQQNNQGQNNTQYSNAANREAAQPANTQNLQSTQNPQNAQNTQNAQNPENSQNTQNAQNSENSQSSNLASASAAGNNSNVSGEANGAVKGNTAADLWLKAAGVSQNFDVDLEKAEAAVRGYFLGKNDGKAAIANIIVEITAPVSTPELNARIDAEIRQIADIDSLIFYLNDVLKAMPEVEARQFIYEFFLEIINNMAEKNELPMLDKHENHLPPQDPKEALPQKSSPLDELIKFVERNINHPAMKTINNYNASNLLQSLINAPGVFTPLSHYIIPIEFGETRAFGELWVSNDEDEESDKSRGFIKRGYHLFLTFDVDTVGRFEIDLRSAGDEVNISLLHPEGFAQQIEPLVSKVGRVVAASGYVTKSFVTGPLIKPHNLTEVFPKILEKREGFNIMA